MIRYLAMGFAPTAAALVLFVAFQISTRPTPFQRAAQMCRDMDERTECSTAIAGGRVRAYCLRMASRGPLLPEFECEVLAGQAGPWARPAPGRVEQVRLAMMQSANPDWAAKARTLLSGAGACRQTAVEEAEARLITPADGYWVCEAGGRKVALQVLAAPPAWEGVGANANAEVSPLIEVSVMVRN
jgi:hypothetical protein